MNYCEFLESSAKELNSTLCLDIGPIIENIPLQKGTFERKIEKFYMEIFEGMKKENILPGAMRFNYSLFSQHGFQGLRALQKLMKFSQKNKIPSILDAKISASSREAIGFAISAFEFWKADSLTINPFLGTDGVMPFVRKAEESGKGVYVINRTSNSGCDDFQSLETVDGLKVYLEVSDKIVSWSKHSKNLGVYLDTENDWEVDEILNFYDKHDYYPQFLVALPDVKLQGMIDVVKTVKSYSPSLKHRYCTGNSICYNYLKNNESNFVESFLSVFNELNEKVKKANPIE